MDEPLPHHGTNGRRLESNEAEHRKQAKMESEEAVAGKRKA